jgi:hypothetical protein
MKKCSISLAIKEMQIKMKLRFYLNPVRMAINKKKRSKNKCRQGCGRKGTLIHFGGNVNYCNHYEIDMALPQKLHIGLLYDPANPLLDIHLKECKSTYNRDTHTSHAHGSSLHNNQAMKSGKRPR